MPSPKSKPATLDDYLAGATPRQRQALQNLRETIRRVAPAAEECVSYGLGAFRLNGRLLVAFGAWKEHCALYPMSARTVASFQKELGGFVTTKGTIRFTPGRPLPAKLIRALVHARMEENDARGAARKRRGATGSRGLSPAKGRT